MHRISLYVIPPATNTMMRPPLYRSSDPAGFMSFNNADVPDAMADDVSAADLRLCHDGFVERKEVAGAAWAIAVCADPGLPREL